MVEVEVPFWENSGGSGTAQGVEILWYLKHTSRSKNVSFGEGDRVGINELQCHIHKMRICYLGRRILTLAGRLSSFFSCRPSFLHENFR